MDRIALNKIIVPNNRLRKVNPKAVDAIAGDLNADGTGMINPVTVWQRKDGQYVLIAGEHRILAAKKAKWTDIPATHWDWQTTNPDEPDEILALQSRFVEAAENVKRHALTAADLAYMDITLKEAKDQIAALRVEAQRIRDMIAKEAAVQAAKDEKAKKAAEKELKKAQEAERKRKARTDANTTRSHSRPERSVAGSDAVKEVAKETGRGEYAIRKSIQSVNAVGGRDLVGQLRGTTLATRDEMEAYAELKKLSPVEADDVLKTALANHQVSAVARLKALKSELKREEQKAKDEAAKNDYELAILQIDSECAMIRGEATRLQARAKTLKLTGRVKQFDLIVNALREISTMAQQTRRIRTPIR